MLGLVDASLGAAAAECVEEREKASKDSLHLARRRGVLDVEALGTTGL
jgi:hypothetical protein